MNKYKKNRNSLITMSTFLAGLVLYFSITSFFINNKKVETYEFQSGKEFLIAENKKSFAPIILPEINTLLMKEAANDLAIYIEKISGAKPEIIIGKPSPIPASAIWVGYQPAMDKLFPGINFTYSHPEEIVNTANENHIAITGRDKWIPGAMSVPDRTGKKMVAGVQQEYGTCNAVYTFLQDQLEVRWLWPGPDGEDIRVKNKLAIKPFYYRYHPTIRDRANILHLTNIYSNKSRDEHKWSRLQRMQLSSLDLNGSHAFKDWWAKYGASHPEYFAMLQNGKRIPQYGPTAVKICQSNPDVWDTWLKETEEQLKKNPNTTIFSAGANDGWSQGHCTCSNCRAWDPPGFSWAKPELSDREVMFANTLARKLKEKYPGKSYQVLILGYGYTRPAPTIVKPDDNVVIMNVSNFLQRADGFEDERTLAMQQYADWGKVTSNIAWRPNIGNPAGQVAGMPDISPHQTAADFRYVADIGCRGLYFDSYWNHWSTQSIQYYAMAQLAWNPSLDIDALLDDYYERAYGPAADEMKKYWELMETTRHEFLDKIKTRARFLRAPEIYTETWFAKAESILKNAKTIARAKDPKYLKRVYFAECGLEFSKLVVDTRKLNQEWEQNKNNQQVMNAIESNWNKAKEMKERFPKYAINFNRSFGNPTATGMGGLHPKNPVNDKTLRRTENIPGYE
jgi:hypothetical protein